MRDVGKNRIGAWLMKKHHQGTGTVLDIKQCAKCKILFDFKLMFYYEGKLYCKSDAPKTSTSIKELLIMRAYGATLDQILFRTKAKSRKEK